ncbi:MAG: LptF/LptG family permease [Pseudomonadota bacterium]
MIIERALRRQLTTLLVSFTAVPVTIFWIVQIRTIIDLILNNGVSPWIFIKLSLYTLPPILPHMVPFCFVLAALYMIHKLYQNGEITILWAAGCKPFSIALPFIQISAILSLFIFVTTGWIAPYSSKNLKYEVFTIKNDLAKGLLQPSVFQSPTENLKIYIQDIDFGSNIKGFFLEDHSDPKQIRNFTAEKAVIVEQNGKSEILLINGRITVFPRQNTNQQDSAKPSVLTFKRFTLDINALDTKSQEDIRLKSKDYDLLTLLRPDENLTQSLSEAERTKFRSQAHQNISAALAPLAYIFIVILFFIRPLAPRHFPIKRIFMVLSAIVSLKLVTAYFDNLSETHIEASIMLYLLPISINLIGGMYLYLTNRSKAL